jgi:hypothetical protein
MAQKVDENDIQSANSKDKWTKQNKNKRSKKDQEGAIPFSETIARFVMPNIVDRYLFLECLTTFIGDRGRIISKSECQQYTHNVM